VPVVAESMAKQRAHLSAPMCPSAQPELDGAGVFGIVRGTATHPQVAYLDHSVPLTPKIIATTAPVHPTEVFRIGAPCAGNCCKHFDEGRCKLAVRLVQLLPAVASNAPRCALRPKCMWWRQEGVSACLRCPQIVTRMHGATVTLVEVARPE